MCFHSNDALENHLANKHFECKACDFYGSQKRLENHTLYNHIVLKCDSCSYEAHGLKDFKRHSLEHDMEVTCVDCESKVQKKDKKSHKAKCRATNIRRKLKEIQKTFKVDPLDLPFKCNHCNFTAKFQAFIDSHILNFHKTYVRFF